MLESMDQEVGTLGWLESVVLGDGRTEKHKDTAVLGNGRRGGRETSPVELLVFDSRLSLLHFTLIYICLNGLIQFMSCNYP